MSLPVVHTVSISAKYTQFGGIQWEIKALYFFFFFTMISHYETAAIFPSSHGQTASRPVSPSIDQNGTQISACLCKAPTLPFN